MNKFTQLKGDYFFQTKVQSANLILSTEIFTTWTDVPFIKIVFFWFQP